MWRPLPCYFLVRYQVLAASIDVTIFGVVVPCSFVELIVVSKVLAALIIRARSDDGGSKYV
jgi:hypothetical protein